MLVQILSIIFVFVNISNDVDTNTGCYFCKHVASDVDTSTIYYNCIVFCVDIDIRYYSWRIAH